MDLSVAVLDRELLLILMNIYIIVTSVSSSTETLNQSKPQNADVLLLFTAAFAAPLKPDTQTHTVTHRNTQMCLNMIHQSWSTVIYFCI